MPYFGKRSKKNLTTCDDRLQRIFNEVIKHVDCSVIEGHRSEDRQNKLFKEGKTKVKFPNGRHNANPSLACDVVPYPIDWEDRERMTLFAGFVKGIAKGMYNIDLRWGGDWDNDWEVKDNRFDDFPHFEIKEKIK
tara:strand:- start:2315 stop:2719 length:405 start_codon:yes stop_codon:yes gene_type:complete